LRCHRQMKGVCVFMAGFVCVHVYERERVCVCVCVCVSGWKVVNE